MRCGGRQRRPRFHGAAACHGPRSRAAAGPAGASRCTCTTACMPEADDWVAHLRAPVPALGRGGLPVSLHGGACRARPAAGDSVEAWARRERYAALADMARAGGAGVVLLAHHRRDQAETLLLQALRGAGPAGLAAMPREAQRDGIVWARPWLEQPREAIDAYVRRHRLQLRRRPEQRRPRACAQPTAPCRSGRRWPRAFAQASSSLAASARRAQEAARGPARTGGRSMLQQACSDAAA